MLMQAVVDFRGLFMDVNIGWPGKVHDARVFVNSNQAVEPCSLTGSVELATLIFH